MRTTLGRSQSRSRMVREYLSKWIVESSTEIPDEGNVRNSSPLRDTVHLPSTARRIFRSSSLIACDYIVGAGFSPRERIATRGEINSFTASSDCVTFYAIGVHRLCRTHSHWQVRW